MLTIFGSDDRNQINFNTAYPYSAIGQLRFSSSSGGNYICSGAMISQRSLMTAAHCVYNRATSSWQKSWKFAAAQYLSGGALKQVWLIDSLTSRMTHSVILQIIY